MIYRIFLLLVYSAAVITFVPNNSFSQTPRPKESEGFMPSEKNLFEFVMDGYEIKGIVPWHGVTLKGAETPWSGVLLQKSRSLVYCKIETLDKGATFLTRVCYEVSMQHARRR